MQVIWYDAYDLMTLEEPLTIKLVANHKSCILVGVFVCVSFFCGLLMQSIRSDVI
jgi:hypothetical protein